MNRREFLRNAAIIAAGAIAVDQLELLERLAPRRLLFPGWTANTYASGRVFTTKMLDDMIKEVYCTPALELFPNPTPLVERRRIRKLLETEWEQKQREKQQQRIWTVRLS